MSTNQYDASGNLLSITGTPAVDSNGLIINPAKEDGNLATINTKILTDTQLRASPVPITGTITSTPSGIQTVTGTVTANIGTTNGLALDTSVNSLLKPSSTLNAITTIGSITSSVIVKADTLANQTSALKVDGSATTQPVSGTISVIQTTGTNLHAVIDSSVLPTGSSTSILQTAGNTSLSSIDTKLTSPLTVIGPLTDTQLRASTVPVSGTVTSNIGTTNGLSLDSSINTLLKPASTLAAVTTLGSITSSVVIKADTLANQTSALKVDGSATTQPISATTLPLPTGAATSANQTALQTSISSIDSKLTSPLTVSGTVVSNIGTTNGLALDASINTLLKPSSALSSVTSITNTVVVKADTLANQINAFKTDSSATIQPISVTTLPLPTGAATSTLQTSGNTSLTSIDTKTPALVSGSVPTTTSDLTTTGVITAINQTVALILNNMSAGTIQITGTWVATLSFEGTLDGTNWFPINAVASSTSFPQPTTTVNGLYRLTPGGLLQFRVNTVAFTSGSISILIRASNGTGGIFANQILPTRITSGNLNLSLSTAGDTTSGIIGIGAYAFKTPGNTISLGSLNASGALQVDSSATTQPVSIASLPLPVGATTSALQTSGNTSLASIDSKIPVLVTGRQPVDGSGVTQPISATTLPLPTGAATSANQVALQSTLNSIQTQTLNSNTDSAVVGNIITTNGVVTIFTEGLSTVTTTISNTWVGTIIAEALTPAGFYTQVPLTIVGSTVPNQTFSFVNFNFTGTIICAGYSSIRIRAIAFTSGTITVNLQGSSKIQNIFVTQSGVWQSTPVDGAKNTFSTAIAGLAGGVVTTDLFTISGSATKTIRITRISFSANQTTASQRDILVVKRSTANSVGTFTSLTNVTHDAFNLTSTAVVKAYTANPTLGTTLGNLRARKVFISTSTTVSDVFILENGKLGQSFVLRGINESLAINLNGVASSGLSANISIEWTEE